MTPDDAYVAIARHWARRGRSPSLRELAHALGCAVSTAKRLADELERQGRIAPRPPQAQRALAPLGLVEIGGKWFAPVRPRETRAR